MCGLREELLEVVFVGLHPENPSEAGQRLVVAEDVERLEQVPLVDFGVDFFEGLEDVPHEELPEVVGHLDAGPAEVLHERRGGGDALLDPLLAPARLEVEADRVVPQVAAAVGGGGLCHGMGGTIMAK